MFFLEIAKFILLIIVTYFFMRILTNKNKKLSVAGTIILCFSSFIVFNLVPYSIVLGELAIICINKIIESKNKYIKALSILTLGICIALYVFLDTGDFVAIRNMSYYIYLALAIWLVLEKRKTIEIGKLDKVWIAIYVICSVLICVFMSYSKGTTSITENQGKVSGLMHLFSYGYSMFLPFVKMENKYLYSSFLSIYPLSLIIAMIYLYKKEKHVNFLMPMIIVIVMQSIFCMTKLKLFEYIGFSANWNMSFVAAVISIACIYLYMYMLANIDENIFSIKASMRMALAFLVLYFLVPRPKPFTSRGFMYGITSVVTVIYFMFINFGDKRYKRVIPWILVIWSIVSSLPALFFIIVN